MSNTGGQLLDGDHHQAAALSDARFEAWDAARYHELSSPHASWGEDVVGRLSLGGEETVLDLGCGTGRVAAAVLERFPRARVIGVDRSPVMVGRAREELGPRAHVVCSDLLELQLGSVAEAAVSSATFHWIRDHDALFAYVRDALVPGAQFVAQCGGAGNIAYLMTVLRAACREPTYSRYFTDWIEPWHFAGVKETSERLERAGFELQACWLRPHPVRHERPREFLETIVIAPYLEALPTDLRSAFLDRVLADFPDPPTFDFVRLNFTARRR